MYILKKVTSLYSYDGECEQQTLFVGSDVSETNLKQRFNKWAELPKQREDHGCLLYIYPYNNGCSYPAKSNKYASIDVQFIIEFIHDVQFIMEFIRRDPKLIQFDAES